MAQESLLEGEVPGPVPLTSASTFWYRRVVPGVVTASVAAAVIGIWTDAAEPGLTLAVKCVVASVGVVVAGGFFWWLGRFQPVWLDGDYLVVGDARRGFRVRLQDVRELKETRLQKMKWVKLELSHSTPLGCTIRFIPRGPRAWLAPWSESPLVEELRQRIEAARERGEAGSIGP